MELRLWRHAENLPKSEIYELHSFSYAILKKINSSGEIISASCAGLIKVVINEFPTMRLIRWVWGYKYLCDGIVSYTGGDAKKKIIEFEKASCKSLKLHYKVDAPEPLKVTMDISAEVLSAYGVNLKNEEK